MNRVAHTQGLWEMRPSTEEGLFDIYSSESERPICTNAKAEDAALLVCSHLMFFALCISAHYIRSGCEVETRGEHLGALERVIRQSNAETKSVGFGCIELEEVPA